MKKNTRPQPGEILELTLNVRDQESERLEKGTICLILGSENGDERKIDSRYFIFLNVYVNGRVHSLRTNWETNEEIRSWFCEPGTSDRERDIQPEA